MIGLRFGRVDRERRLALAVEQNLKLMRFAQALDMLVAVARQADLDLIFAVLQETCTVSMPRRACRSVAPRRVPPG